ncbi:DDE_Tnp_1_7 domain-containing protein [Trichonephila inaurata madagascariensis]|uniref:DDE_Tnp_1_7 domain-containing protein n=1 Tax=Trichonephila inaurata madagascariensis TaxID=2747483 RepID=A0A8X6XMR9_9ARAC|nr:DDE_Tnp_1_7 domain-containing protein [Trichonephila inaurata madagascariensis]
MTWQKCILTQDEIDKYMNNLDELSELCKDGLECSDDDFDFLPDCVSSIEDSDSESEINVVHLPNYRTYWSEELGFDRIKDTMPLKKFETIRQYLHFNDNDKYLPRDHANHDKLHKIRHLYDELNKNFAKVPLERHLSIDEQIFSTKIRYYIKQYLAIKPHKWGFKFFVLCGISGFAYKLEIYSGQENNEKYRQKGEPDLGASANVVIQLARIISRNKYYKLYFDNYYTSIPLLAYLSKEGLHSLET